MTTDWKALCADLLRELDHASAWDYQQALKDQARAALAQPELEGPAPEGPSDEELYDYWISTSPEFGCADPVGFARAVLARWGHQPAQPAEGELGPNAE